MPKCAMDYSNTHFYKIICKDVNIKDCYVGHTTNFMKRKHHHKNLCHNPNNRLYNCYKYELIRENGGWDNWKMVLIKTEHCENVMEAERKETEYIQQLNATLNKVKKPFITEEEKKEYDRQYHIRNKEKHNEQSRTNHQKTKERDAENAKNNYQRNQEERKQKSKERYDIKKNKINERMAEKITCECGAGIRRGGIWQHKKSIIHQQYLQSLI